MPNIRPEEIKIEKLGKEHDIKGFQCYEKELVKFLNEDALDNHDKINLEGNLKKYFNDKNIKYSNLPSLKIARLAVDNRFLRRGLGTLMIEYIVRRAKFISIKIAGCRFVTVDAKKNSILFYQKNEFQILREGKEDTVFMHLDVTR